MIAFSDFVEKMVNPTPGLLLQFILITAAPYILIPVVYLKLAKKWTLKDFGFRKPIPNSRAVIIFAVILFAIVGALPLLNSGFTPISVLMLMFSLWQPAFIEEFFFRGVIQGRLERILGQNKAWIYAGGWIFGIIYMKTRSLWPGMFVHYITDGRLASIIARSFLT